MLLGFWKVVVFSGVWLLIDPDNRERASPEHAPQRPSPRTYRPHLTSQTPTPPRNCVENRVQNRGPSSQPSPISEPKTVHVQKECGQVSELGRNPRRLSGQSSGNIRDCRFQNMEKLPLKCWKFSGRNTETVREVFGARCDTRQCTPLDALLPPLLPLSQRTNYCVGGLALVLRNTLPTKGLAQMCGTCGIVVTLDTATRNGTPAGTSRGWFV